MNHNWQFMGLGDLELLVKSQHLTGLYGLGFFRVVLGEMKVVEHYLAHGPGGGS